MTNIDTLTKVVTALEAAHEQARADLEARMPDVDPYQVVDTSGRFVLLDTLTALVNARTALAHAAE